MVNSLDCTSIINKDRKLDAQGKHAAPPVKEWRP